MDKIYILERRHVFERDTYVETLAWAYNHNELLDDLLIFEQVDGLILDSDSGWESPYKDCWTRSIEVHDPYTPDDHSEWNFEIYKPTSIQDYRAQRNFDKARAMIGQRG